LVMPTWARIDSHRYEHKPTSPRGGFCDTSATPSHRPGRHSRAARCDASKSPTCHADRSSRDFRLDDLNHAARKKRRDSTHSQTHLSKSGRRSGQKSCPLANKTRPDRGERDSSLHPSGVKLLDRCLKHISHPSSQVAPASPPLQIQKQRLEGIAPPASLVSRCRTSVKYASPRLEAAGVAARSVGHPGR